MKKYLPILLLLATACKHEDHVVDLIVKNAVVYTVDSSFTTTNAFVVNGGRIISVGDGDTIEKKYTAKEVIDAGGKAVYPGFIDAHSHFYNYGVSLQEARLENTKSWQEVVDSVSSFARRNRDGWITGRGWDQNKWAVKQFPTKGKLDSLFPVRPVVLGRIDGHAIMVNQAALNIAGIKPGQTIAGGKIETVNGKLTGLLVDNAEGLVRRKIPPPTDALTDTAFLDAQHNCFAAGLTTVEDCGLPYTMVNTIAQLQHKGALKMRMYVMLSDSPDDLAYLFKRGVYKTPRLDVRSIKCYADGALGSRGACLLQPYSDQKNWRGFLLSSQQHFQDVAEKLAAKGFQMCTHAIGDSANRVMLKIYASV
jgi:hypothetical protein